MSEDCFSVLATYAACILDREGEEYKEFFVFSKKIKATQAEIDSDCLDVFLFESDPVPFKSGDLSFFASKKSSDGESREIKYLYNFLNSNQEEVFCVDILLQF